jgi:hypothetical protein
MPETLARRESLPAPAHERRAWVRLNCHLETTARAGAMRDIHWFGTITDLSRGGLCLVLQRAFQPGTRLEIELNSDQDISLAVTVVRIVRQDGQWVVGCEMDENLTDDQLAALLRL